MRNLSFTRKDLILYFSLLITLSLTTFSHQLGAQSVLENIRKENAEAFKSVKEQNPFTRSKAKERNSNFGIKGDKEFLTLTTAFNKSVLNNKSELLKISIPLNVKETLQLNLQQVEVLSPDFILTNSKDEIQDITNSAKFYWGFVEGYPKSVAAINVFRNELSGTIDLGDDVYTITKIEGQKEHLLYKEEDLIQQPETSCFADEVKENVKLQVEDHADRSAPNADNCVLMYVEIDYDLFQQKGSVNEAYNYFAGAFSQVAILYANENINITLNQVKVWDEVDPYTGPSTGDFMDQFMAAIGTNYNGTLAHLVGTQGSGGIAYVNVVCNKAYGFGYSGIHSTYNDVPSYSWTVNVLTHEIGHNLGSPHTHACSWNGNNTQIDDCGNQVISNPGSCYNSSNPIIPSEGGTIMSYCHLRSVGMDFTLGFGTQPGDLIRDRVYNANCLTPCGNCEEQGNACDDGDPCTTNDTYDSFCNCVGITSPDEDGDGVCAELDPDDDDICVPNECADCTFTTISLVVDNYPTETSWEIRDASQNVIASGSGYTQNTTIEVCLEDGCYDFVIFDTYGDGMCCAYGNGSYTVRDSENTVVASGGNFTFQETTNFCYTNFSPCADLDEDDICDDVDPCYDPMIMDMGESLESGSYSAKQQIILNVGTVVPENATIYLNAPSIKFMDNTVIPNNATIVVNDTPCEQE